MQLSKDCSSLSALHFSVPFSQPDKFIRFSQSSTYAATLWFLTSGSGDASICEVLWASWGGLVGYIGYRTCQVLELWVVYASLNKPLIIANLFAQNRTCEGGNKRVPLTRTHVQLPYPLTSPGPKFMVVMTDPQVHGLCSFFSHCVP